MKTAKLVGILLVALGIISFTYQGITYTKHKKILDIGSIQATREEKETIPLPPIVGAVALMGGIVLLISSAKKVT